MQRTNCLKTHFLRSPFSFEKRLSNAEWEKLTNVTYFKDPGAMLEMLQDSKITDITNIIRKFLKIFKKTDNLDKMSSLEIISYYTGSSKLFISKTYQFDNLPEPRNVTEGIFHLFFLLNIVKINLLIIICL